MKASSAKVLCRACYNYDKGSSTQRKFYLIALHEDDEGISSELESPSTAFGTSLTLSC